MKLNNLFMVLLLLTANAVKGQDTSSAKSNDYYYRHGIEASPLSPVMNIYGVLYSYGITRNDYLVGGPVYMRIKYDFGNTNAWALIVGYRRYLWKNLHIEYQLYPTYDDFYESVEKIVYPSFDLWNEFRLGYRCDFKIKQAPLYMNIQWPLGFGLYASNKPESFKKAENEDRFFYFPPMIFLGARF
jgi:hypothetical protein